MTHPRREGDPASPSDTTVGDQIVFGSTGATYRLTVEPRIGAHFELLSDDELAGLLDEARAATFLRRPPRSVN